MGDEHLSNECIKSNIQCVKWRKHYLSEMKTSHTKEEIVKGKRATGCEVGNLSHKNLLSSKSVTEAFIARCSNECKKNT